MALKAKSEGIEVDRVTVDLIPIGRVCNYSNVGCEAPSRFRAQAGGRIVLSCGRHLAVATMQLAMFRDAPSAKRRTPYIGTKNSRAVR